jgi:AcrR family transcriptional regulator
MTMGRPRTTSDEEVLAGTARAIARVGPARLTLAEVGREVGLAPATLVQRFGSKRGLMLALVRHSTLTAADGFADAGTDARQPLRALVDAMVAKTEALTPEALSNHMAFLQLDLADPEFRQLAGEHARATRDQIRVRLDAAVADGQLPRQDTERLARSVHVAYNGALLTWALEPEGQVQERVREEIEFVLAAAVRTFPAGSH